MGEAAVTLFGRLNTHLPPVHKLPHFDRIRVG